ncbi:MAG TPA: hypothetical protein VNN09_04000 [Candidatus Competibacteraceae bacterium]|nr:hypothetical protein [Candidatus Competibacteraceae bacterium]
MSLMRLLPRSRILLLLATALGLICGNVLADKPGRGKGGGKGSGVEQAASELRQRTGGQVLRIVPEEGGGLPGYKAKILLPGGKVRTMRVPPRDGGQ